MNSQQITELLQDTKSSLIEVYLKLQNIYEQQYGSDTVVVMEVGSFFEVYGVDNETEKIGKPKEIGDLLNIQLTRKNKSIAENNVKNPLLVGFPTATFDRYISRLMQAQKYTIVIVRQRGVPPHVERYVDRILSPGVNIDYCLDSNENFTTSIILEKHKGLYSAGYAALDVSTGKSYVYEIHSTKEDPTFVLDELFHQLQARHTSEVLLHITTEEIDVSEITEYLEVHEKAHVQKLSRRIKVSYQNELFKHVYNVESFLTPIEFLNIESMPLASEALAALMDFVIEHDHTSLENSNPPEILQNSVFLHLGNDPLEQLSIISHDPDEFTVWKFCNNTVTSIGSRLLYERIRNPIVIKEELIARYDMTEAVRPFKDEIKEHLKTTYDIERIIRRIRTKRLHPFEINFLYDTLQSASHILRVLEHVDLKPIVQHLKDHTSHVENALGYFSKTFNLDESTKVAKHDIKTSFFSSGIDQELDILVEQLQFQEQKLEHIRNSILEIVQEKSGKSNTDFVQIKQLDKEGHYIHLTKSRFFLIEKDFKKQFISIDGIVYACGDFSCKVQTTNVKITAPVIDEISEAIVLLQNKICARVRELFVKQLEHIDREYSNVLEHIAVALAQIDVAYSNVVMSETYACVRPDIIDSEEPIFEMHKLRHPLVEHREQNGIYVPNDVLLGIKTDDRHATMWTFDDTINGVLLYGINSSGKSSLMKSIGIAVIMAQAGLYVTAEHMKFTLVKELFTRIVSRDNIQKGLSSFAVEMVELKNIFNRCTKHSLVLGDEISHGTETLSAIAIVSAAIKKLSSIKSLFFFTTHLHQLQSLSYIKNIPHIASLHLAVRYDKEQDVLLFDRTLQKGSGSDMYGLEFAQSLHMDEAFITEAMKIRRELSGNLDALESLQKQEVSKYNKDVYLVSCAICSGEVEDTHHIREQHTANEKGHIDHFHKDHAYNLIPLCKSCHIKVHQGKISIKGFVMTSSGLKLELE